MKIIDLSLILDKDKISLIPGHPVFHFEEFYFHERDLRAASFFQMSTHTGTHVDAPYHFVKDGLTIDKIPLEKLVGKAVMIDLRGVSSPRKGISLKEMKQAVAQRDLMGKIVILSSGWLKEKWGKREMYSANPFLLPETAEWLVAQGIKSLGHDFSLDDPDRRKIPAEKIFPIHRMFLEKGIPHIENLCNLELIDQDEFLFVTLPLKLYKGDGAPAGAIAIMD